MEEEDHHEYKSVALIPIPEDLPPDIEAEYTVCKGCLVQLENEWNQIKGKINEGDNENENENYGDNEMCKSAYEFLDQMEKKYKENHESIMNLRIEISERQRDKEIEKIKSDCDEAKKSLFERLVRGHYHAYKCITSRLKELMGKDYQSYIEQNEIEFPQIPSDSQMKTRYQQPEETKSRNSHETEQELQRIDDMFKDYMALVRKMNFDEKEENDDQIETETVVKENDNQNNNEFNDNAGGNEN